LCAIFELNDFSRNDFEVRIVKYLFFGGAGSGHIGEVLFAGLIKKLIPTIEIVFFKMAFMHCSDNPFFLDVGESVMFPDVVVDVDLVDLVGIFVADGESFDDGLDEIHLGCVDEVIYDRPLEARAVEVQVDDLLVLEDELEGSVAGAEHQLDGQTAVD
jgi:hypothetical protein